MELGFLEQRKEWDDAHIVQIHLSRSQEKKTHIDRLHKLVLSLGADVISSMQQPVSNLDHHLYPIIVMTLMGRFKKDYVVYVHFLIN